MRRNRVERCALFDLGAGGIKLGENKIPADAEGWAYVGNFGFDLDGEIERRGMASVMADHPTARLACISPQGVVTVAAEGMNFPNGSVITPDGKTLIVGESFGGVLTAFDIAADRGLSGRRVWAPTAPRIPDGICLDAEGAIWVANPTAPECVRFAEGGAVLEVIDTGQPCYACMLGGPDGRTLFMLTAETSIGHEAAKAPRGRLLIATVDSPRAGRP